MSIAGRVRPTTPEPDIPEPDSSKDCHAAPTLTQRPCLFCIEMTFLALLYLLTHLVHCQTKGISTIAECLFNKTTSPVLRNAKWNQEQYQYTAFRFFHVSVFSKEKLNRSHKRIQRAPGVWAHFFSKSCSFHANLSKFFATCGCFRHVPAAS